MGTSPLACTNNKLDIRGHIFIFEGNGLHLEW